MPDNDDTAPASAVRQHNQPAVPGPEDDLIDLLLAQHAQIEELFLLVTVGPADRRREAFDQLVRMLAVHETAEEEVLHPLARDLPGIGDAVVDGRLEEEREAKQMLTTLIDSGVDSAGFDMAVLLLRRGAQACQV